MGQRRRGFITSSTARQIGNRSITGLIAELLCGDDPRAESAAQALAETGAEALPAMQELLAGAEGEARWWAVRVLAALADPRALPLLVTALQDSDLSVRQCAALALGQKADPQTIPYLVEILNSNDSLLVRLAANALIAIGQQAVPALLERTQNGPQVVRLAAIRALALIGDPASLPALFAALDDNSALVVYWADEGLSRMGIGMMFFKPEG